VAGEKKRGPKGIPNQQEEQGVETRNQQPVAGKTDPCAWGKGEKTSGSGLLEDGGKGYQGALNSGIQEFGACSTFVWGEPEIGLRGGRTTIEKKREGQGGWSVGKKRPKNLVSCKEKKKTTPPEYIRNG